MSEQFSFSAGEVIIKEGDKDTRLFVLQSGELEIRKGEKEISVLDTPASMVGEIGVVLEEPRTCSVIAKTDCELMLVGNDVNDIIESSPRMTKLIMQELAEKLLKTTAEFASISDVMFKKEV